MQSRPDTSSLPLIKPTPAGHTGAETELSWQLLPRDPRVEHKQDPL